MKCLRKSNLLPLLYRTLTKHFTLPQKLLITLTKIKPPPPIFVKGIIDFSKICEALIELMGVDNFYCKSSSDD